MLTSCSSMSQDVRVEKEEPYDLVCQPIKLSAKGGQTSDVTGRDDDVISLQNSKLTEDGGLDVKREQKM